MKSTQRISLVLLLAICGLGAACGGGSSAKSNSSNTITAGGQNVAAVSVNGGPNNDYANGVFVSVTVCVPSTSTCQTVPDVLVDTGSSGLRILSSALTISLPQQQGASGPVAECLPFVSGFTWGPVQTADVSLAGEKASGVPVQVIDTSTFPVPSQCSAFGSSMNTLSALGSNGLLGVGLAAADCGTTCAQTSSPDLYWQCPSSGCQPALEAVAQQVTNPVAMFSNDNNGVILELPSVSSPQPSVSGSLVFGIGTQSNNALSAQTVYTVDQFGNFTTAYKGQSYNGSFLDSGSNGYFFLDQATTGIQDCTIATGFYCPSTTQNLTATNQGTNGSSGTVNFSVANAETLFNSNNFAFGDLGGPGQDFDWGLPFFYGRNVYVAIEGKSNPGGTGPFWAY